MRILHINKFLYRRGGAEGYMLDLADMQRDAGHDVRLFGMDHPENDANGILDSLPSYIEFEPAPVGTRQRARAVTRMLWSREVRQSMEHSLLTWQPDVVHCHNIYHQLSPSVLAPFRSRDIPVILTMHDYKLACPTYEFLDKGELCTACVTGGPWQAARRACKDGSRAASTVASAEVWLHRTLKAYSPVRRFIAPSQFLADQVSAAGSFPDRITVLNNFTVIPSASAEVTRQPRFVFAGRLSPEKGVATLMRAVAELSVKEGSSSRPLLEVAGDGPQRQELEELANRLIPGLVLFHGRLPKSEVESLVRSSLAVVVPSEWHENQPLTVLEAFAGGTPVISTGLGGLPEVVRPGETGWIVEPRSPRDLAAAMSEALGDPAETLRRGTRARVVAEERFNPWDHLRRVQSIYEEVGARS